TNSVFQGNPEMVLEICRASARLLRPAHYCFYFGIALLLVLSPVPRLAHAAVHDGWDTVAVGAPRIAGSASYISCGTGCANLSITAGGTDIGGTKDEFRYVYRALNGDGALILRVTSIGPTNTSAKAGIMIRETLDGGSRNSFIGFTASAAITYS